MVAAFQTSYDDVGLPFLPYPHPTVLTMHKERVAPLTRAPPELDWEADFGCHGDFAGGHDVTRRQHGVRLAQGVRPFEEGLDTLPSNLLRRTLHV